MANADFNFRLKLKKICKITRLFRYDLNQIPYDDIVEVANMFKGLGLIYRSDRPSRTNTPQKMSFSIQGMGMKKQEIKKHLEYRPNRQIWPGVQNEAGQRLIEFCQENTPHWLQQTPSSNNTRDDSTHGHHQMVNTKIRVIYSFAAKNGEALDSQQKQDQEMTMAQLMNSLLPNSDFN